MKGLFFALLLASSVIFINPTVTSVEAESTISIEVAGRPIGGNCRGKWCRR